MINEIFIAITSLINSIGALIVQFKSKKKNKCEEYYEKVLIPFLTEYHDNSEIDCISFFKQKIKRSDEYVPPYLFYIYDNSSGENRDYANEEMKKVLLMDYKKYYKNFSNTALITIEKIANYLCIVCSIELLALAALFMYLIIYTTTLMLGDLISLTKDNMKTLILSLAEECGITFLALLILMVLFYIVFNSITDEYSLKIKDIKKIISKKVDNYDKVSEKIHL